MAEQSREVERIKAAQATFMHWRVKRGRHWMPLPDELWREAVALLDENSVSKVARALRLSQTSLKEKADEIGRPLAVSRRQETKAFGPTFIETRVEEIVSVSQGDCGVGGAGLTIRRPDGAEMILSDLKLDEGFVLQLVSGFVGGL